MNNEKEKLPTSPDWATAPGWAQLFAIDEDGTGFWYEFCPGLRNRAWWPRSESHGRVLIIAYKVFCSSNWENSLQKRPD